MVGDEVVQDFTIAHDPETLTLRTTDNAGDDGIQVLPICPLVSSANSSKTTEDMVVSFPEHKMNSSTDCELDILSPVDTQDIVKEITENEKQKVLNDDREITVSEANQLLHGASNKQESMLNLKREYEVHPIMKIDPSSDGIKTEPECISGKLLFL